MKMNFGVAMGMRESIDEIADQALVAEESGYFVYTRTSGGDAKSARAKRASGIGTLLVSQMEQYVRGRYYSVISSKITPNLG